MKNLQENLIKQCKSKNILASLKKKDRKEHIELLKVTPSYSRKNKTFSVKLESSYEGVMAMKEKLSLTRYKIIKFIPSKKGRHGLLIQAKPTGSLNYIMNYNWKKDEQELA